VTSWIRKQNNWSLQSKWLDTSWRSTTGVARGKLYCLRFHCCYHGYSSWVWFTWGDCCHWSWMLSLNKDSVCLLTLNVTTLTQTPKNSKSEKKTGSQCRKIENSFWGLCSVFTIFIKQTYFCPLNQRQALFFLPSLTTHSLISVL
jgi:hypothetical protein